ncbi:sialate O-acetylesterase [Niabella insulamsoli]|uniref:sialate O-acetylesterase n=1 Tax=Niabella insulamsoli TaxID=3144874 RepID=UPI0031FCED92
MNPKFAITLSILFFCFTSKANIRLPVIFQSDMVLQRDKPCPVWGYAANGEEITIRFKNKNYETKTVNGRWKILLPAQPAGGPFDILINGHNSIRLENVLFGDVWICSGQSNMQFSVKESKPQPDSSVFNNQQIRLFNVDIGADFVPRDDLKGGEWKIATTKDVRNFSAVGFYFGDYLQSQLHVPIGLIASHLGATSIEEWMSNESIRQFPQFSNFYDRYIKPSKYMKQLESEFEAMKPEWMEKYYLLNDPGLEEKWFSPEHIAEGWKPMHQPSHWEDNELRDYDGSVWFRKRFDSLPKNLMGQATVSLGQVDDYNICWVNGHKVGEGYGNMNMYSYTVPDSVLKEKDNLVVVRVFDAGGKGGMYNMFWSPYFAGEWAYKKGVRINPATFKKPLVPNAYIFGTPTILYNANIAPLAALSIKGFAWYQGEANVGRAAEYKTLLPAMINGWREAFRQGDLPFLIVQLPNYGPPSSKPEENEWAELREAQCNALQLPHTALAVTIDLGASDNLHPLNKLSVGQRLAQTALSTAYKSDQFEVSPRFKSMKREGDSVIITFDQDLKINNGKALLTGFAVAGSDHFFHWAVAHLHGNRSVVLRCRKVPDPRDVRYLWSGQPPGVSLYNAAGMPATPFRTDDLEGLTHGKTYHFEE